MKKNVSLREMIMLGVLIIIVAYYFLIQMPVSSNTKEYEARREDVNSEIDTVQTMLISKLRMQKEIDAVLDKGGEAPEMLQEYSNVNNIILELNAILDDTENYSVNFSGEEADEDIVRRGIQIHFSTKTYAAAISKLTTIHDSKNQYLIESVNINDNTKDKDKPEFGVVIQLKSFEYIKKTSE